MNIIFTNTHVIWLGSDKYSTDLLCPDRNLSNGETTLEY